MPQHALTEHIEIAPLAERPAGRAGSRRRCAACSLLLHGAVVLLALLLGMGGGAGGRGSGTGDGAGAGSGGGSFLVSGFVTLGGARNANRTGDSARAGERDEARAGQEPLPLEASAMHGDSRLEPGSGPSPALQSLPEAAPDPDVSPKQNASPAPERSEAVPLPLPEKRTEQKAKRDRREPAKTRPATQTRPETRQAAARATPGAAVATQTATAGDTGTMQGPGEDAGKTRGAGDGQGPGSGGVSGRGAPGGSGAPGFGYALNMVDRVPKVLRKGPVFYPESARRKRLTGSVTVRFLLDERGEMTRVHVLHAAPPDVFNDAALAAVKKWKFAPALKDGKAVPVWVDLPLRFSLR